MSARREGDSAGRRVAPRERERGRAPGARQGGERPRGRRRGARAFDEGRSVETSSRKPAESSSIRKSGSLWTSAECQRKAGWSAAGRPPRSPGPRRRNSWAREAREDGAAKAPSTAVATFARGPVGAPERGGGQKDGYPAGGSRTGRSSRVASRLGERARRRRDRPARRRTVPSKSPRCRRPRAAPTSARRKIARAPSRSEASGARELSATAESWSAIPDRTRPSPASS